MIPYREKWISNNHCILLSQLIDSSKKELFEQLQNYVINFNEFNAIKSESRQLEWLHVRLILCEHFKRAIEIIYDAHEKPVLKNQDEEISISHSAKWIALSISKSVKNGIDIELISNRILKVKERFLRKEDEGYSLTDPEQLCFLWSIKEAAFKAYGKKDIYLKDNIRIDALDFNKLTASASVLDGNLRESYQLELDKIDNHTLAYVLNQ